MKKTVFTSEKIKKKIGLALGSGGARGLSHIGVIKTLLKNNIPIDLIAGTSAGSLIGGMYAALHDIEQVEKILTKMTYKDLAWILSDATFSAGALKGQRAIAFLQQFVKDVPIESLTIPFAAVATDLQTGQPVIIAKGNLIEAIRASVSVPLVFQPVWIQNTYCIDGGASEPVPVDTAKKLGADIVIAVNCDAYLPFAGKINDEKQCPSSFMIAKASIDALRAQLAHENARKAHIIINPYIPHANFTKFVHGEQFIEEGCKATEAVLPEIRAFIHV